MEWCTPLLKIENGESRHSLQPRQNTEARLKGSRKEEERNGRKQEVRPSIAMAIRGGTQ